MGEELCKLPKWLPTSVMSLLNYNIAQLDMHILPAGVTKETRLQDILDFLEYPEVDNVIKEMSEVSEKECAQFVNAAWVYSYLWDHDRMQKYKSKDVIKYLAETKKKLNKFRREVFPLKFVFNQDSLAKHAAASILQISLNKVFQKYFATESESDFAKILSAKPELLEDCNALPNISQLLDLIEEQIQEEIDILRDEPRGFDSLLPTKLNTSNPNNAKSIFLQKNFASQLSKRLFPLLARL